MPGPVKVRASRRARKHSRRAPRHLYRNGARERELERFEEEYGIEKGKRVYGATVAKVHAESVRKGTKPRTERVRRQARSEGYSA
jgi:hypothetical protein